MSQKRTEQSGASKRKRKQIDEAKKNTNNSSFKKFFTPESIEPADSMSHSIMKDMKATI